MAGEIRQKVLAYFSLLKRYNRIGTSYLFVGGDFSLLKEIVKLINCQRTESFCSLCDSCVKIEKGFHPDVLVVRAQGSYIKIDTIREAQRFLAIKNFLGLRKVLIVEEVHRLTTEAANAFLKTIEEPPGSCFLALSTSRVDMVLPTINSRCKKIYLPAKEENRLDKEGIEAFWKGEDVFPRDREKFSSLLLNLILFSRDYLVFSLTKDTNMLIERSNYEIIFKLNFTIKQLVEISESLLEVYNSLDNINLNLASNLLRMKVRK